MARPKAVQTYSVGDPSKLRRWVLLGLHFVAGLYLGGVSVGPIFYLGYKSLGRNPEDISIWTTGIPWLIVAVALSSTGAMLVIQRWFHRYSSTYDISNDNEALQRFLDQNEELYQGALRRVWNLREQGKIPWHSDQRIENMIREGIRRNDPDIWGSSEIETWKYRELLRMARDPRHLRRASTRLASQAFFFAGFTLPYLASLILSVGFLEWGCSGFIPALPVWLWFLYGPHSKRRRT